MAKTYNDIRKALDSAMPVRVVFSVLVFAVLMLPLVGMLWAPTDESVENRELADWPLIYDEEAGLNVSFLSQAGDYFSDHYAYRVPMIDAGAHLYAGLFGVSTADTVIVGNDGWLYYAGTLNDYQDRDPLRDNEAYNMAHNLRMLQDYCEERGAKFVVTVAPDKNTLYGTHMPFYYPAVPSGDRKKLSEAMQDAGVNYVNMFVPLADAGERLYFYRDSHWTEKGALVAHELLAGAAGFGTLGLTLDDLQEAKDYTGDLSRMLYPLSPDPEVNWYIPGVNDGSGATGTLRSGSAWEFTEGESVEDSDIETTPSAETLAGEGGKVAADNGGLLMFRDSFGNSLIPYLACEFEQGTFSKKLPYNALLVDELEPSVVIVERAQRHMDLFAQQAPLMVCPLVELPDEVADAPEGARATCEVSKNGPLGCLQGVIEGVDSSGDYSVMVRMIDEEGAEDTYNAFLISDDEAGTDQGYCVYVDYDLWAEQDITAEILVRPSHDADVYLVETHDVRLPTE